MANSSAFPILDRWPAGQPERLQLYSVNTPNGVKVSIMLEEIGLPYEALEGSPTITTKSGTPLDEAFDN